MENFHNDTNISERSVEKSDSHENTPIKVEETVSENFVNDINMSQGTLANSDTHDRKLVVR